MAKKQTFLTAEWSEQFKKSYAGLQHREQKNADKVILALLKREPTPGMRVKPIEPDKYYSEARINDGDRLIFHEHDGVIWFIDLVTHDDIGAYSKKPRA
ncbi:MAG TPA: hypothetical protein VNU46_00675 [Gemmatimonadaceae bacterium]|nr:hypothetical protein [Gemmatimonadaceae bacterium]